MENLNILLQAPALSEIDDISRIWVPLIIAGIILYFSWKYFRRIYGTEDKTKNSIKEKLLAGALIGWLIAFVLMCVVFGSFPRSLSDFQLSIFLSLAPGTIVGIIVTYITAKVSNNQPPAVNSETQEERLIKLKTLLDQGVLTQEEFDEQKKKILQR